MAEASAPMNGIPLREFLAGLRQEMLEAQKDALASGSGRDRDRLRFAVGPVEVEFTLAATKELDGKAGVKFYVFELGGGGSASTVSTQRVKLTLTPVTGDGRRFEVNTLLGEDPA